MNLKTSCFIILFLAAFLTSFSQNKLSITAGFGFPELLNAGLRLNGKQTQFGLTYGTIPIKDETTRSFSANLYVHFGGTSKLSSRKPWFMQFGLNHFRNESFYLIENYTYFNTAIGREMNISKRFGIEFHAGTVIQLHETIIDKQPTGWDLHISIPVLPSFGFVTFYKV
jgi:hypothetical protein